MGVLDKFLDIMKLNDDDEYEDDFFDDDEYEEEKPRKSFFKSSRKYDEDEDDEEYIEKRTSRSSVGGKVTPMRQPARKATMEVCVIKPTNVDDAREVTETLLSGSTVILNLEGMDLEIAQRIIDFTSGATFAISGNLQKISNYIFLVTPTNVDISGDLQDLLNSSFDVPSIKTRY
ncbi:MAG: cell division protein SepF [Faecalimonas sp.]|nr:cell division protein SepF [Faecalimonas sp.]